MILSVATFNYQFQSVVFNTTACYFWRQLSLISLSIPDQFDVDPLVLTRGYSVGIHVVGRSCDLSEMEKFDQMWTFPA